MASDYYDFSRTIWDEAEQAFELTCPACGVTRGCAVDDDPERCSCGAAYDRGQYENEQAEAEEDATCRTPTYTR